MNDDTIQALRNHALADQAKTLPRTEAAFASWSPRSIREEFERMERDLARMTAERDKYANRAALFSGEREAIAQDADRLRARIADLEAAESLHWLTEEELKQARSELAAARKWIEADSVRIGEIPILRASLARESAEVAELRRDKERLDWMLANGDPFEIWINTDRICVENRDAIDAAMKETTP